VTAVHRNVSTARCASAVGRAETRRVAFRVVAVAGNAAVTAVAAVAAVAAVVAVGATTEKRATLGRAPGTSDRSCTVCTAAVDVPVFIATAIRNPLSVRLAAATVRSRVVPRSLRRSAALRFLGAAAPAGAPGSGSSAETRGPLDQLGSGSRRRATEARSGSTRTNSGLMTCGVGSMIERLTAEAKYSGRRLGRHHYPTDRGPTAVLLSA
jgi:hypothetical protein